MTQYADNSAKYVVICVPVNLQLTQNGVWGYCGAGGRFWIGQ